MPIRSAACTSLTGFLDAQVNFDVDDNYQGKKGDLFVTFHVTEGSQSLVQSLEIEGNKEISTDALLAVTGSTAGQPYSDANVASDRNNILAMYYDAGFPEARFRKRYCPAIRPTHKRLVYHVTEGTRIEVSQVLLTGYQFTRPGIILRQVQIHAAEPLRESQVVETQRQLYNLGVFNRVQIAPQNPDGTDPMKAVVVDAQEGSRYTIGYGFGFEVQKLAGGSTNPTGTTIGASPRGIFEISRSNMFGRAQTLSFRARASTLQYRALLGFTANNLLTKKNLSLQLSAFADKTQDVNTFTSHRYEGSFQVVQTLSPWSSLLYRYFYRRVEVSNISNTINPKQIPLLSQPTLVSGFGITYARDHRDNPGDATRGTFNTLDVSDAVKTLGSSASFFRGFFQNSSFTPFGRAFVFARSTRFGIEEPFGNTRRPGHPSAGAVLCRWRNFVARVWVEPGGPPRPGHGFSDRRPGASRVQPGNSISDEIAIRGKPAGRNVALRRRKCLQRCEQHFVRLEAQDRHPGTIWIIFRTRWDSAFVIPHRSVRFVGFWLPAESGAIFGNEFRKSAADVPSPALSVFLQHRAGVSNARKNFHRRVVCVSIRRWRRCGLRRTCAAA